MGHRVLDTHVGSAQSSSISTSLGEVSKSQSRVTLSFGKRAERTLPTPM